MSTLNTVSFTTNWGQHDSREAVIADLRTAVNALASKAGGEDTDPDWRTLKVETYVEGVEENSFDNNWLITPVGYIRMEVTGVVKEE